MLKTVSCGSRLKVRLRIMPNSEIKALREMYGLTRKQFCEALEIPYRTVQAWELGDRSCPVYTYLMIKKLLELAERFGTLEQFRTGGSGE